MDLGELQARKAKLAPTETKETVLNPTQVLEQMKANKLKAEGTNVEKWFHSLKDQLIPCTLINHRVTFFCLQFISPLILF